MRSVVFGSLGYFHGPRLSVRYQLFGTVVHHFDVVNKKEQGNMAAFSVEEKKCKKLEVCFFSGLGKRYCGEKNHPSMAPCVSFC